MADESLTGGSENSPDKMPGKIHRSVSSMVKDMEMTEEEMKYRMENFEDADIGKQYVKYLKCTRCNLNFQNIINKGHPVGAHPLLGVLLCDSCCDYYGDGNFSMDSEGEDKYCRWCGQGGTIFACSKCICGFCEECIKKHFGKQTLEEVKNDDDWVCYFCNPRPLWYLRSICSLAKEAAKSKREQLESVKEGKNSKKKKTGDGSDQSSDSDSNSAESTKSKSVKRKRFSKLKKAKRDSSSSSDDEAEMSVKKRRKGGRRSSGKNATEESSGSDRKNPRKKAKTDRDDSSDFETLKTPLLERLRSIWKLTQTATEVGLKSSRERLMNLSKGYNFNTVESLRREHEDLKSCISVLASTLNAASKSAGSIGEDLKIDPAKDDREILQSQERELKRFEKRFEEGSKIVRTSSDSERSSPWRKVKENSRKDKEESEEKSEEGRKERGEGENGSVGSESGSEKEEERRAKPLLKVKSFARMLEENVYDKAGSVNGNHKKSGDSPVVIDLYDVETDESVKEERKKKSRKSAGKKLSESEEEKPKRGRKSKDKKDSKEGKKRGRPKKKLEKSEESDSEEEKETMEEEKSEVEQSEEKKEDKEEDSDKAKGTSDEESVKGKDKSENGKETSDEESPKEKEESEKEEKKESESDKSDDEKENSGKESPKEKEDSSSDEDDTSKRRITRNKKKEKPELKASFKEFKEKREKFLKSSKEPKGKKITALESSESDEDKNEKGKPKKRVLSDSEGEKSKPEEEDEDNDKEEEEEEEKESEKENQKSDSDARVLSSGETSSDEINSKVKRKRIRKRSTDSSEKETKKRGRKKKRKSSESSGDDNKKKKGRKNIKKILKKESLQVETKEALKNEEERKKRLKERQKLFEEIFPQDPTETSLKHLVLDFDPETKDPLVTVHKKLVKKLKPHQAKGVRFMWDNCFESVQRMEEDSGSGCILAHCMGLGKTFQVITLVHTVLSHDLGVNTVLIVCPLSTVANWIREFDMWLGNIHTEPITLYDLIKYKRLDERRFYLKDWQESGGVLVISYDMFRNLTKGLGRKKKSLSQKTFESALLDPGPDLVICDEGHLLKNEDTALSKCMSRVKTARRVVLTGTPLQNNLIEYHCMVQFVKPNILGTKKEFCNRFVNPISNGQFEDSTELDVKIMKRRSHVLHSMLEGCIQRFDYSVLTPFLPEKHEYVLSIALTETQAKLYRHFIANLSAKSTGSSRTASLFNDYHSLQKIWTHPRTMLMHNTKETMKEDSEDSLKDFVVSSDEEESSSKSDTSDSSVEVVPKKRLTRSNANDPEVIEAIEKEENEARKRWWDDFVQETAYEDLRESNKLIILFDLLKHCETLKDKVLVFSQSLYSLDLIEYFLGKINDNKSSSAEELCGHQGKWHLGTDYFRLDGSTSSEKRASWCNYFNKESNTRARLFLLSTKAGGLGINLYGANRVVIFDASWNPSHDLQSIFRVYRFGQKKPCYVYRFLSEATMEEKIYERQVTKLSLAHRVVDEHQIERHYTMGNLQGLYMFEPTPPEARKVPKLPKDPVLADLLAAHKQQIVGYHEHDSLLENKQEEELSEEERKAAWKEYEEEKVQKTFNMDAAMQQQLLLMQARAAQGSAQDMNVLYVKPANVGQAINPMFFQSNPNIPLAVHQRGMKVGILPMTNESLESYFMRILKRENWLMTGGQQQQQQQQ